MSTDFDPHATAEDRGIMRGFPPPPEQRINHYTWDKPPFHRWSFQHVREVVPTVNVGRGRKTFALPKASNNAIDKLPIELPSGHKGTVSQHLAAMYTDGFLVVHKGKRIYERYFNGMDARTQHISQSMAKSVVGTVAGILIDRGTLKEDDLLTDYVPELGSCGYAGATVRHLLDMRSGIRYNEDYLDPDSDVSKSENACGWRPPRPDVPESLYEFVLTLPAEREHGGHFAYRSIETDCLAWVLERASGSRLSDLVSDLIWQPMGAEQDGCFTVDRAGACFADGGFNATLRDFARFGMLYIDGRGVVPDRWIADTKTGDVDAFVGPHKETFPRGAYRNQFWLTDVDRPILTARGIFGQLIYIDPTAGLVVTKLSSWPTPIDFPLLIDTLALIEGISGEIGAR